MFSYRECEAILARLHHAEREQETAFRARLKNLKKFGIPFGVSPGRGARVAYSHEHLYQWALCLEFAQLGIDPSYISGLMRTWWEAVFLPKLKEAEAGITSDGQDDLFLEFTPRMVHFSTSVRDDPMLPPIDRLGFAHRKELDSVIDSTVGDMRRVCILNISDLVRRIMAEGLAVHDDRRKPAVEA